MGLDVTGRVRPLSLGFSPCPNDTFVFHDLVHVDSLVPGIRFEPELLDIEALNQRALDGAKAMDVTKLSIPAFARCLGSYTVLCAGAALGRGCGPLLVRRRGAEEITSLADLIGKVVAIPGQLTTAFLLLGIYGAPGFRVEPMRFDQIMPAVAEGRVDAGLVIHEGRFTYEASGLAMVADLGECWEEATDLPLPLAVIGATASLGEELIGRIEAGLRQSVENALARPERSRDYVRAHAQEMSDEVCRQHIRLYVNDYSVDLGTEGRRAIEELLVLGRKAGLLAEGPSPWR